MKNIISFLFVFLIVISCKKKDDGPIIPPVLSSKSLITSFELNIKGEIVVGHIDQQNHLITLNTVDADLNSLVPIIEYSEKATITPATNVTQNFNEEVVYTVRAENGNSNVYRVQINNQNSENKILSFQLEIEGNLYDGIIDESTGTIYVETDRRVDSANAVISASDGSNVAPIEEDPQNFYQNVEYIITGETGSQKIYTVKTAAYEFFNNGYKLFYSNALAGASGTGIDLSIPNSSVVLENSQNSYTLETINTGTSIYTNGMPFGSFSFYFPDNIISATDYKLKFLINGEVKTEANYELDVLTENVPNAVSLNQDLYVWNDILIITGENLPDTISIPSNGSIFIIKNSNNYDLVVNDERTELTLTLDYDYLFPSYFLRPQEEKTITLYGPGLRVGATIQTVFK